MKRWGLYRISNLCLVVAVSGGIATAGLATPDDLSPQPKEQLNRTSAVLLTQADEALGPGSTGDAVKDLQAMLALMGYYSGAVDGAYEQMTLEAVRQFQTDAGLSVDGIVGPLTWQRLLPTPTDLTQTNLTQSQEPPAGGNESDPTSEIDASGPGADVSDDDAIAATAGELPILQLEDSGADVSRLQRRLATLELYAGPIDGIFGVQTQQAVELFQSRAGLNVDGIVGPATWLALFE